MSSNMSSNMSSKTKRLGGDTRITQLRIWKCGDYVRIWQSPDLAVPLQRGKAEPVRR